MQHAKNFLPPQYWTIRGYSIFSSDSSGFSVTGSWSPSSAILFFLTFGRYFIYEVRNNAVQGDCSNEKLSCPGLSPVAPGIDPPNTHRGRFLFLSLTVGKDEYQNKNKNSNNRDYLCIFLKTISFFSLTNLCRTSGNSLRTLRLISGRRFLSRKNRMPLQATQGPTVLTSGVELESWETRVELELTLSQLTNLTLTQLRLVSRPEEEHLCVHFQGVQQWLGQAFILTRIPTRIQSTILLNTK